jgi:hypothetical protein
MKISFSFSRKLLGVIDFFRHGARAPLTINSNGFDILNLYWEHEKGSITSTGLRQLYLAGVRIRETYINNNNLISSTFDPDQVGISSTDLNRTILSAYSRLNGMFPTSELFSVFDPSSNSIIFLPQIVPVLAISYPSVLFQIDDKGVCKGFNSEFFADKDSHLLFPINTVVKINYWVQQFENTIFPSLKSKLRLSENDLRERKNDNPRFIYHIADALICAMTEGRDISSLGLSSENITFFKNYKDFFLINGKRTDYQLKLMAVPLYDNIIEIAERFLSGNSTMKYIGYSIHDKNLITLYRTLRLIIKDIKTITFHFACELLIEVYDDGGMNFLFNNENLFEMSIKDLKTNRNDLLISKTDFNNFCGLDIENYGHTSISKLFVFFIVFDSLLIIILFIFIFVDGKMKSSKVGDSNFKEIMLLENPN